MTGSPGGRPARAVRPGGRRWSLRARLVLASVSLIAVVCAVVGGVTAIALNSYLHGQLDAQLAGVAQRAFLPTPPPPSDPGAERRPLTADTLGDDVDFVLGPGQPPGTLGMRLEGREVVAAARSTDRGAAERLTTEQTAALVRAVKSGGEDGEDGDIRTADIPGAGGYRLLVLPEPHRDGADGGGASGDGADGGAVVVGLPLAGVEETISTLVVAVVAVSVAALIAAGLAGTAMIRIALRPLRRVAATASRVSGLRLDRGEVAPLERVPDSDTDPRTEVGQVGAALNMMLDHVGSALAARHASENRVRQFVADASHELRTPLASIRGYAELTRRGPEETGPDTRHALGRIESEVTRMTVLVEDLLLLARLDAGRPLCTAETDLSPLVVDAVSDARAAGPDHRWRLGLPDEPAVVCGDAERLHQVLVNLLGNARTHTPSGTTVTARLWCDDRAGGGVLLEIEDDGPGIPADTLPHVFERFARGDASRGRAAGGTGLGLAIVQAVVAAHSGRVAVESTPGRTVFSVRLPRGRRPTHEPGSAPSSGSLPGAQRGSLPRSGPEPEHRPRTQP